MLGWGQAPGVGGPRGVSAGTVAFFCNRDKSFRISATAVACGDNPPCSPFRRAMNPQTFLRCFVLCSVTVVLTRAQSWAPPAQRQSIKIHQTVTPRFPEDEMLRGVTMGRARIALSIDHTGSLKEWLVVGYTKPAFAAAAVAAVRQWTFEPMRVRGEAVSARCELNFDFQATGVIVSLDATSTVSRYIDAVFSPEGRWACALEELDRVPARLVATPPGYSQSLGDRGIKGRALIEFFIGEDGTVRLPTVITADHEELGVLAAAAVRTWKFEPPLRHGRPVLARARQVFNFEPGSS